MQPSERDEPITVTVLDTVTGQRATSNAWPYRWWAADGNGGCDCNREMLFSRDTDTGYCLGCSRYLIVETSAGDLAELNSEYPHDLVARFISQAQPCH